MFCSFVCLFVCLFVVALESLVVYIFYIFYFVTHSNDHVSFVFAIRWWRGVRRWLWTILRIESTRVSDTTRYPKTDRITFSMAAIVMFMVFFCPFYLLIFVVGENKNRYITKRWYILLSLCVACDDWILSFTNNLFVICCPRRTVKK